MDGAPGFEQSEILKHSFGLLAAYPNDPAVWKERRSLVCEACFKFNFQWNNELNLVGQLIIEQHPKNYRTWDYRRWIVEKKIGSHKASTIAAKELEFTQKILFLSSGKNFQAWSHREWTIRKFDTFLWLPELQFCREIFEKNKNNLSVWDQICRAARESNLGEKSRLKEAIFAKKAISARLGIEGPWTYLKVLYHKDKKSLYKNPDLECIFVDVLSDEADRIKISKELNPDYDYNLECCSMDKRDCVHALNLIADLIVFAGYDVNKNTRLVEAVNVVFHNTPSYPWELPKKLTEKGILGKVYAATVALGANRIRSCHKYKGSSDYLKGSIFGKYRVLPEEKNTTLCDKKDNSSPQLVKRLSSVFKAYKDVFISHPELRKLLFQIYLKKGTRSGNEETTLEEDLKWDVRRCVVKEIGTDVVGLDELQFTTDMINEDANNHRAWSYRQWVFQTFGRDWEDNDELDFCANIFERDTCNSFAWDHRNFLLKRWDTKMKAARDELSAFLLAEQQHKRVIEDQEYAFKFIVSEPENELPWSQMFCDSYFDVNHLARDVVLRVLEDAAKDCCDNDEGIMGGDGQVVGVNARGITNAVNMLLELKSRRKINDEQAEVFSQVMDQLCPDSYFDNLQLYREPIFRIPFKSAAILRRMQKALPSFEMSWENVTDRMLRWDAGLENGFGTHFYR